MLGIPAAVHGTDNAHMVWAFADKMLTDTRATEQLKPALKDLIRLSNFGRTRQGVHMSDTISINATEAVTLGEAIQIRERSLADYVNKLDFPVRLQAHGAVQQRSYCHSIQHSGIHRGGTSSIGQGPNTCTSGTLMRRNGIPWERNTAIPAGILQCIQEALQRRALSLRAATPDRWEPRSESTDSGAPSTSSEDDDEQRRFWLEQFAPVVDWGDRSDDGSEPPRFDIAEPDMELDAAAGVIAEIEKTGLQDCAESGLPLFQPPGGLQWTAKVEVDVQGRCHI